MGNLIFFDAFGPEQLDAMSRAFELVCDRLGLKNRNDAFAEMVAVKIIHCGRFEQNPDRICEVVLSHCQLASALGTPNKAASTTARGSKRRSIASSIHRLPRFVRRA
jgi:hypothetical protein